MAMFYKDNFGKMVAVNPVADDADANMGLNARDAFTKQSQTVDMIGPIHSDIFFQDRLILNSKTQQSQKFFLLSLISRRS